MTLFRLHTVTAGKSTYIFNKWWLYVSLSHLNLSMSSFFWSFSLSCSWQSSQKYQCHLNISLSLINVISSCPAVLSMSSHTDWTMAMSSHSFPQSYHLCPWVSLSSWKIKSALHLWSVCYFSCSYYRIFSVLLDNIHYTPDSQGEKSSKYYDPQCFSSWRLSFSCIANSWNALILFCDVILVNVPKMEVLSPHSLQTSANCLYLTIWNYIFCYSKLFEKQWLSISRYQLSMIFKELNNGSDFRYIHQYTNWVTDL